MKLINSVLQSKIIQIALFSFILSSSLFAQINTNLPLTIDTSQCYINDNFRNTTWGNLSIAAGYGSTKTMGSWLGTIATQVPAYNKTNQATVDGVAIQYKVLQARSGNYNDSLGLLNLKDLFVKGNSNETYSPYDTSQVQSYLELPALPSVGKMILYVLPPNSSLGIVVESKKANGTWIEVARFADPTTAKYISLDTLTGNNIISQTPVTYRIRSYSYNKLTSNSYGPLIAKLMVQKYIQNDIRPPYPAARPYFPPITNTKLVINADSIVLKYTEAQWLNMMPRQAPRSMQPNPTSTGFPVVSYWSWNPDNPNQIIDSANITYTYGKSPYKAKTQVMTGDTVDVPYYKTLDGVTTYVDAEIDYQKFFFIEGRLQWLGSAYQQTGNEKYARYVALALDKLSKIVPYYFMTYKWNTPILVSRDSLLANSTTVYVQRASDHNGFAHELDDAGILSLDLIYESNALKKMSADSGYNVRDSILKNFFLNITNWLIDVPTMDQHTLTNNLTSYVGSMIRVAAVCPDSAEKEKIMDFVNRFYGAVIVQNFKRDGMFPEAFSYHVGYADETYANMLLINYYYNLFPPKNAKQAKMEADALSKVDFCRKATQVQDSVAFPNGDLAPFNDTYAGTSGVRDTTESYFLPAYQFSMLGFGTGKQQIQANMTATDKNNHIHNNMLGMTLFAKGNEQLGNIRYSRIPGRVFTNSTMGQNLVVVNQSSTQYYSSSRQYFGNDGHFFTNGFFTLFEPGMDSVAVTEAYSNTTNPDTVTRYQRLHILNNLDSITPYLIDVFVVQGGIKHDYVLNGSTQVDQVSLSSLPLKRINKQYPLLPAGQTYTDPVNVEDDRNWYGVFRNMDSAKSTGNWNVTFKDSLGTSGVKIFGIDDGKPIINVGRSPYCYRRNVATSLYAYWRPSIVEQRVGTNQKSKSVFIHVMQPYSDSSLIDSVTALPVDSTSGEYLAINIHFKNGRRDVALINLNHELITGKAAIQTFGTLDKQYHLTGKVGLFVNRNNTMKGYLFNGSKLTYRGSDMTIAESVYQGTISNVLRKVNGDKYDAFVTNVSIPETKDLNGKWISLRYGRYTDINPPSKIKTQSGMNELFKIDSVAIVNGLTYLILPDDPTLVINGDTTTEIQRPQRRFIGATSFKILKSKTGLFADTSSLPLPISIVSFSGKEQGCMVNLKWRITNTSEVNQFLIEKSNDGVNYTTSAFVSPYNSADYSIQLPIQENIVYYRLKIIDKDGKYVYSKSIELTSHCDEGQKRIVISPNPSKDYLFNISLVNVSDKTRLINVFDNKGKRVFQDKVSANTSFMQIRLPEYLSAGIYLLKIEGLETEKLVIEK